MRLEGNVSAFIANISSNVGNSKCNYAHTIYLYCSSFLDLSSQTHFLPTPLLSASFWKALIFSSFDVCQFSLILNSIDWLYLKKRLFRKNKNAAQKKRSRTNYQSNLSYIKFQGIDLNASSSKSLQFPGRMCQPSGLYNPLFRFFLSFNK